MKASSVESPLEIRVRVACGFVARARGLLGRPAPAPACGLLLVGVRAVHAFGLRHGLDLVYLDAEGGVAAVRALGAGGVSSCRGARHVLEMRQGEAARLGVRPGRGLRFAIADDIFGSPPPSGGRTLRACAKVLTLVATVIAAFTAAAPSVSAAPPASPGKVAAPAADSATPRIVDRYSGAPRRNRVKTARGSLNAHPADESPARPLKPRARASRAPSPPVEYLVGDPKRRDAVDAPRDP